MRELDAKAVAEVGDVALMRAAGQRIAQVIRTYAKKRTVVAFAGPGNNGGDAFAALAALTNFDRRIYAQPAERASPARQDAESQAAANGVQAYPFPNGYDEALQVLFGAGLVLVGLVGTGARLPLPPAYGEVLRAVAQSGVPAIAIDIPPGVDGETGAVVEPALRATATVTLATLKPGLLLSPGRAYAGELWLADIGIPPHLLRSQNAQFAALNDDEFLQLLPERASQSDKRASGAPLIVAGSQQFPGAPVLAAMGAARAGAGYVTVATPSDAAAALRTHLIEQVVVAIDPQSTAQRAVEDLLEVAKRSSSVGIGPGMGLDDRTGDIVRGFVGATSLPIVADASALFHFAKNLEMLRSKPIVLTPHAGEFARLSGKGTVAEEARVARLREFVDRTGVTTLLKGESTLVYDGRTMHINTTGTPALATAGTGDVLTGIISTLLSQGLSPVDAARAGAYWHGRAGQTAAAARPRGVIARDVYDSLAAAIPEPPDPTARVQRIF
jgi:NAD(P)H-hydrate epimerase